MSSARRRSREDWIDAAFIHGADVGFDRIAVEPLAARIGATKGSFYWHFADRSALLDAVLERWESVATQAVIASVRAEDEDPEARLMDAIFGDRELDRQEWRIFAAADDPRVGAVVARVHSARIDFLADLLRQRGMSTKAAAARAHVAYAAYLGNLMLRHGAAPTQPVHGLRDELRRLLSPGEGATDGS
ncbi:MAG: TetR/AcrR family transcriptional regulator [Beutenbergiaceae bacterium]